MGKLRIAMRQIRLIAVDGELLEDLPEQVEEDVYVANEYSVSLPYRTWRLLNQGVEINADA